jgi:hypothetical protein
MDKDEYITIRALNEWDPKVDFFSSFSHIRLLVAWTGVNVSTRSVVLFLAQS